ncbi:MAG TPA: hypothetical protein VM013_03085 [Dehalococcoidia bacterium]|nr:hypothetical protein [Dehalococcoidia bacterium]
MGRLRLFGELIEAGGAIEGGGEAAGGGHQVGRVVRTAGDYQTSSTSFVDIDTENLAVSLTTGDSWVYLLLTGTLYVSSFGYGCFDFTIDGQRQGATKGVQQVQAIYSQDVQIGWLAQVSAGSHVFRAQWRVSAGAALLRASSAESPTMLAVVELK